MSFVSPNTLLTSAQQLSEVAANERKEYSSEKIIVDLAEIIVENALDEKSNIEAASRGFDSRTCLRLTLRTLGSGGYLIQVPSEGTNILPGSQFDEFPAFLLLQGISGKTAIMFANEIIQEKHPDVGLVVALDIDSGGFMIHVIWDYESYMQRLKYITDS